MVAYDGALCRPFCRTDRGAVQKWPLRGSVPGPCFRGASARSLLGSLQPKRRCPAVGAFLGGHDACREWSEFCRRARSRSEQRSEEHTSELQSLMRTSYAVFCLKKKTSQPHMSKKQ